MPMVSVIMPAYNASKTIEAAIISVLNQSFKDFELIVVNDCSVDDTEAVVRRLAQSDNRIRIFNNEKNSGVAYSRNLGVEKAFGEWIAFLDSDDMWRKDKLEKQLELAITNPEASLTYTASGFMSSDGTEHNYVMPVQDKINHNELLRKNLLSCSSVMVKRDLIKDYKMPSDNMSEDYAVWLMILKDIDYAYGINEPLLIYRLSENSKSSNRVKAFKMHYNSYRYVGYNGVVSFLLTAMYVFYSVSKRKKIKEV